MKKKENDYVITYKEMKLNRFEEKREVEIVIRISNKSVEYATAFVDGLTSILPLGTNVYINKLD